MEKQPFLEAPQHGAEKKNTGGSWGTIGKASSSMEIDGYVRAMTKRTWLIQHPANKKNTLESLSQGAAGLSLPMLYVLFDFYRMCCNFHCFLRFHMDIPLQ